MPAADISLQQARNLQLAAQGLLQPVAKAATPAALRACIARMQLLQIDTIHVVARSPYLVLFSRLGPYPQPWLDQALARGHLFETWAHEACFAPIADLARHRAYNQSARRHWGLKHGYALHERQREALDTMLQLIEASGPVRSSDFERKDAEGQSGGGWWGWKDEKRHLEALFATGELAVARREGFQRIYDLAHRVFPGLADLVMPEQAAIHAHFIEEAVAALGITQARWVNDYFRLKPRLKDADLDALVDEGRLLRVPVEGWGAPGYVHPRHAPLLRRARREALEATHTTLLSPFDPLVWDRERASAMFGFDYRIECYTPEHKRNYGYFVLPVLRHGQLVARLDAKAHRADGIFEVKALYLEPGVVADDALLDDLAAALQRCAHWHATPQVTLTRTSPPRLRTGLRAALRRHFNEKADPA